MKHKGSVVITRYNEPDQLLLEALESLKLQKGVDLEILMLDQIYSEIIKNYCKNNSSESIAFHYIQIEKKSLSYAKNT